MSSIDRGRRVRRGQDGKYILRIPLIERRLLADIPEALGHALDAATDGVAGTPELMRLFPPAYTEDDDAERSYRELMQGELLEEHRLALSVLEETANAKELGDEQMNGWLSALNDARLVLGTTIGVSEESEPVLANDDDRARYSLYLYLSVLVEEIVDALAGGLPEVVTESDYWPPEDPWGDPPDGLRWTAPGAPNVHGSGRVPIFPSGPDDESDSGDGPDANTGGSARQ